MGQEERNSGVCVWEGGIPRQDQLRAMYVPSLLLGPLAGIGVPGAGTEGQQPGLDILCLSPSRCVLGEP